MSAVLDATPASSAPATALRLRVVRRVQLAERVLGLDLEAADGSVLPAYTPGAHIELRLPGGITRQYSLHGPSDGRRYGIGVLHAEDSRGGSRAVHEHLQEGDLVQASAPRNHFALRASDAPVLLLAAGIGITPIIAMADALAREGRPFELHYVAASPQRMAFAERIRGSGYGGRARLYFHGPCAAQTPRLDIPALLGRQCGRTEVYVCGPHGFIQAAIDAAAALNWPKDRVTHERFGAVRPLANEAVDGAFEVELARSGKVIRIAPDQTIVEAMLAHGLAPDTSCEQGVCGTCLTRVLDGEPDHRDSYLTDAEKSANDQMLICCSRARSARLVLAL